MPCLNDIHQDHSRVANEGVRAFRNITILGYELIWNNFSFNTTSFVKLGKEHIKIKIYMRKKIWYISKYSIAPNYTKDLGNRQSLYAKHFAKNGFDVRFIYSYSTYKHDIPKFKGLFIEEQFDDVIYNVLNGPKIEMGFNLKRIISWIIFEINLFRFNIRIKETPNVVIVSSLSLLTVLNGIFLKKKYGAKLVFEIRDIWPLTLIQIGGYSKNNPFVRLLAWVEKKGYNMADLIVGTMPNLKEHIRDVIKKEFKFTYMPMGIDLESNTDEKKEWDIPENTFIAGYAGAIGTVNQVNDILEAAKLLKNENVIFAILGDGTVKKTLQNEYKDLNNVIWLPKVDKRFVNSFLLKCDILLNPWKDKTLYRYGVSPNKWIDYMYAAKPIIVSYNGFQCIVNEADCGEFIEAENPKVIADKVLEYSRKPKEELEKIGQNGKQFLLENMNYEVLAKKYISAIEN